MTLQAAAGCTGRSSQALTGQAVDLLVTQSSASSRVDESGRTGTVSNAAPAISVAWAMSRRLTGQAVDQTISSLYVMFRVLL